MRQDQYFSIGQASKICGISVQTLRFYDKIGLVKPEHTDAVTGYRYYANSELLAIKIVQDMKALKFSLDEIKTAMTMDSLDGLLDKLEAKRRQTAAEMEQLAGIVESIDKRKSQIGYLRDLWSGLKHVEVLVEWKRLPDQYILSDRRRSACGMDASIVQFTELFRKADALGTIPDRLLTVYHENIMTFDRNDSDLEFCISAVSPGAAAPEAYTRIIPGGEYITALYCGIPNEESCKRVYLKLREWMDRNRYAENGPAMELYLVDMAQMMKPEEFIVELQIPVRKALTL